LGEAFFKQPMLPISDHEFQAGTHYSDSRGVPELREKISGHYAKNFGASVDPETEILISAGSKPLLYMCMLAAAEPGGEVLIHEPGWLSYAEQALLAGAVPRFISYDTSVSGVLSAFSTKTNILIINNPNNPAGRLYGREEILELYEGCVARNIYLLLDESYSDFAPPGSFTSLTSVAGDKSHALVVNSLSKNLGVSGWRIGYLIAQKNFIDQVLKINQHLITCAPTLLANYCAKNFKRMVATTEPQLIALQDKRSRIAQAISQRGLYCLPGSTTFYFFVSIQDFCGTDTEFARKLLVDHCVAVVPGSAYGNSTGRFVRISIGTETESKIEEALDKIAATIQDPDFDSAACEKAFKKLLQY
jgi:aspartate/methionine/tyrosine aminotransferase